MGKLKSLEELFAGRHFGREDIISCVRSRLRYKLSLRDIGDDGGAQLAVCPYAHSHSVIVSRP